MLQFTSQPNLIIFLIVGYSRIMRKEKHTLDSFERERFKKAKTEKLASLNEYCMRNETFSATHFPAQNKRQGMMNKQKNIIQAQKYTQIDRKGDTFGHYKKL